MATLDDLVAALSTDDSPTTSTSLRQPRALRTALQVAVQLGLAPTANEATTDAVRATLERFALQCALDEPFAAHPHARPSLHEVAHGLAVIDNSPLMERQDLLDQAEVAVLRHRPAADAEDVLLWATSLLEYEARV